MSMKQFGEFLRDARKSLGLETKEVAILFGVHPSTYRRWERGCHIPQQDMFLIKETVVYMVSQHMKKMNEEWERLLSI